MSGGSAPPADSRKLPISGPPSDRRSVHREAVFLSRCRQRELKARFLHRKGPWPRGSNERRCMKKSDDLGAPHLEWLILSRMRNQNACLRLFNLFEKYTVQAKGKELRAASQLLVAAAFSLWRAAFLADKTGQREAVFNDARAFLATLLTNNAINYPQDRASREWTFNYYMTNANDALVRISNRWENVASVLSKCERVTKGTTNSRRRWNRHQNALETALDLYEQDLLTASEARAPKPAPRDK